MALLGACSATPRDLEISRCDWSITGREKSKQKHVQKQNFFNFLAIKIKHFLSANNVNKCKLLQGTFFINVPKMYS